MNINDVKQLKQHYQTNLIDKISTLLSISRDNVMADWSLDTTVINVSVSNQNTITNFTFEYKDNNFLIHSSAYKVVAQGSVPIGIIAESTTIELETIHQIFDIIVDVLSENNEGGESNVK